MNNLNVGDDSALAPLETFTFLVISINYAYFGIAFFCRPVFAPTHSQSVWNMFSNSCLLTGDTS